MSQARRWRRSRRSVGVFLALCLSACASAPPRSRPADDYLFPTVRAGELSRAELSKLRSAWERILEGRASAAEQDLSRLVRGHPKSAPLQAALGYARLRQTRLDEARRAFESALAVDPEYVPALAGAGAVARRQERFSDALQLYRRADELSLGDPRLKTRLTDVRIRLTETALAEARQATAAGEGEAAVVAYRQALEAAPELGEARRELADRLVELGRGDEAIECLASAPGPERSVLMRLGELHEQRREWAAAFAAYERWLSIDRGDAEAARRAGAARATFELQQLPEEYRRIFDAARVTRAELAALADVKLSFLGRFPAGQQVLAIDISGSWARDHVLRMLALGLMDVYPNHSFQPGAIVRRDGLASLLARVLDLLRVPPGGDRVLADMSPTNLYAPAAARVVAAGLMDVTPAGAFEPWRPVSGKDAAETLDALARLVAR